MKQATIPALYGMIGLDGQPANLELLRRIGLRFASPWAPVARRWVEGPCAVEQRLSQANPSVPNAQQMAICGRITNRAELDQLLGPQVMELSDELVVSLLWDRYGDRVLDYLDGNFIYVRWRPEAGRLEILTSKVGSGTLYFGYSQRFLVFSTRAVSLLGLPDLPKRLDIEGFVRQASGYSFVAIDHSQTCFQGVRQLGSSYKLIAGRGGVKQAQIWTPSIPKEALEVTDRYEAAFELQKRMRRAMLAALPPIGRAGILLSGGLDSTALASLAPPDRLMALCSAVPPELDREKMPHEMQWQDLACRELGLEQHSVWPTDELGPLIVPDGEFDRSERPLVSFTHDLYRSIFRQATELELKVVIDGCFGEFGPSNDNTDWLLHLFLRGSWGRLAREASRLAGPAGSTKGVVRSAVLNPLRAAVQQYLRPKLPQPITYLRPTALTGIEQDTRFKYESPEEIFRLFRANPRLGLSAALPKVFRARPLLQIPHAQPFSDPAIWSYCAGLPLEWCLHQGQTRGLLRTALKGRMPEAIRTRPDKAAFSPTQGLRVQQSTTRAILLLRQLASCDSCQQLFELPRISQDLLQLDTKITLVQNWTQALSIQNCLSSMQFLAWFESV